MKQCGGFSQKRGDSQTQRAGGSLLCSRPPTVYSNPQRFSLRGNSLNFSKEQATDALLPQPGGYRQLLGHFAGRKSLPQGADTQLNPAAAEERYTYQDLLSLWGGFLEAGDRQAHVS